MLMYQVIYKAAILLSAPYKRPTGGCIRTAIKCEYLYMSICCYVCAYMHIYGIIEPSKERRKYSMIKLLKAIGMPATVRNFMVDFVDREANYYHQPLQTIVPTPECWEEDSQIISYVQQMLAKDGYNVCSIMEATGEYEMEELNQVFNSLEQIGKNVRVLYLNPLMAFGPADIVKNRSK